MKTRKLLIAFLLVSLLFSCMGVPAQAASKITVLNAYSSSQAPEMYVALSAGTTGTVPSNVKFYAGDSEELPIINKSMPNGHIVVIDRSEYYSRHITANHVAQIVKSYLQLLPSDDLVKFIFADAPAQDNPYVDLTSAINRMNAMTAFTTSSPLLSTAISKAFAEAASQEEGTPVCKTVAVVANPSQASAFNFNTSAAKSVAYFTVMVPTRAMYEKTSNVGFAAYKAGRSTLSELAAQMGGSYIEIPETGDVTSNGNESFTSVDTSGISAASAYLNCTRTFAVDISHLSELAQKKKGEETFTIEMRSQGNKLGTFNVNVPVSVLPTPKPTATPKPTSSGPTPEPTATPIPIVIKRGDTGIDFRKAIYTLIQNYYLREDYLSNSSNNETTFDDEAQVAYDLFCELNNLPMTDGISEDGFFMLTDTDAKKNIVPAPTATPSPVPQAEATPIPIYPQENLRLGDKDSDLPSNYIQQIQAQLQALNCFMTENGPQIYTPGLFDQATMDAIDTYCKSYNVANTVGYGASKELCEDILSVKRSPIVTPTPVPVTPTPAPTIPPVGYRLGDKDSDLNSNFIQQLQAQLQSLNCYITEEGPQVYTPGLFDQATMNAVTTYCKHFNVANTSGYGASKELCEDILNVKRSPIVTPTPVPVTPTPAPTIPAAGYRLGDTDEAIPGGFIQALQTRLQALNCYATVDGVLMPTLGVFDDATMQAITAYCETYSVNNTVSNGVSASICQDILNTERAPRATPTISLGEQIKSFLMRPLFAIGTFQVIMWMALVLCAVLVVGIVIVILMMKSGDEDSMHGVSGPPSVDHGHGKRDVYETVHTTPVQPSERTVATDISGKTVMEGFGMPVSLRIEYLDRVRNESPIISSTYTIGRRDCALLLDPNDMSASSKHAMLYTENGQLFVRDLDSTNGTYVNNNRISKMKNMQSALSDKTMVLDESDAQEQGYMLNRGDVIRLGKHRITVNW